MCFYFWLSQYIVASRNPGSGRRGADTRDGRAAPHRRHRDCRGTQTSQVFTVSKISGFSDRLLELHGYIYTMLYFIESLPYRPWGLVNIEDYKLYVSSTIVYLLGYCRISGLGHHHKYMVIIREAAKKFIF